MLHPARSYFWGTQYVDKQGFYDILTFEYRLLKNEKWKPDWYLKKMSFRTDKIVTGTEALWHTPSKEGHMTPISWCLYPHVISSVGRKVDLFLTNRINVKVIGCHFSNYVANHCNIYLARRLSLWLALMKQAAI